MKNSARFPGALSLLFLLLGGTLQSATINVSIRNNFFSPAAVTINVGDTVTWTQNGFNHNTESDTGQAEFWRSPLLNLNQTFSHTFSTPGTYTYFCQPHRSTMRGTVTVQQPAAIAPSITSQPQSQTVNQGEAASFNVAVSGTAPFTYQWQKDQANIPGANGSSFSIPSTTTGDRGNYRVLVSNSAGSVTSQEATLTVNVPSTAPVVTMQPQDQTISQGETATFSVGASGTDPLSYQWLFNDAPINGANDPSISVPNAQPSNAGSYRVRVSNSAGTTDSRTAVLNVSAPPAGPSIATQPQSLTVMEGGTANFFIAANGTGSLRYQWILNNTDLAGATNSNLTLSNVQPAQAGNYQARVTDDVASVLSSPATLTVSGTPSQAPGIAQQPQNSTVNVGQTTTFSVVASGTGPFTYQWQFEGTNLVGSVESILTLPNVQHTQEGRYRVIVGNNAGSTVSAEATLIVFKGPTNAPLQVALTSPTNGMVFGNGQNIFISASASDPDGSIREVQFLLNDIPVVAIASAPYQFSTNFPPGTYRIAARAINAEFNSATTPGVSITVTDNPILMPPVITQHPESVSSEAGQPVTFSVLASGSEPLSYQWQKNGVNLPGAISPAYSIASVSAADEGGYAVVVSNSAGSVTSQVATLTVAGVVVPGPGQVRVTVQGNGTVTPSVNERVFQTGRLVRLTAVPRPGHLFGGWSGDLGSSNAILNFIFRTNVNLTATFGPNPFPAVKGKYSGLFHNPTNIEIYNSGLLSLTLNDRGRFTGRLLSLGRSFPFSGQFNLDGETSFPVLRRGTNPVTVTLRVDLTGSNLITGAVSGAISNETWTSDFGAHRAVRNARTNPAPEVGRYTLYLPDHINDGRRENSIATIAVDASGNLTLVGNLSDGTPIAQRTFVAANGEWPLYVPAYRGQGAVFGWVRIYPHPTNETVRLFIGMAYWIKPPISTNDGFTLATHTQGSSYRPGSLRGSHTFELGGSDFENLTYNIQVAENNAVTVLDGPNNQLQLALNNASGLYSGSFRHPVNNRTLRFKGVWVSAEQAGYGYFLNGQDSGYADMDPPFLGVP